MADNRKTDNPAEPFKKALGEATRALANEAELNVTYSVDPSGIANDTLRLPQISRRMTKAEVMLARGAGDASALRMRFHNAGTHNRYAPQGEMARGLYEAMETARCELLGARAMPGVAANLDARLTEDARKRGLGEITDRNDAPIADAAAMMLRCAVTGRDAPEGMDNVLNLWRDQLQGDAGEALAELANNLEDQAAFARQAWKVIEGLGYGDQLGENPDGPEEEAEDGEDAPQEEDSRAAMKRAARMIPPMNSPRMRANSPRPSAQR